MSFLRIFSSSLARFPTGLSNFAPSQLPCRLYSAARIDLRSEEDPAWRGVDAVTNNIAEKLHRSTSQSLVNQSPAEIWAENSKNKRLNLADVAQINNNPYSGRSVRVVDGDLADAFRRLDVILARNKVRRQLKLAERHEKKGPKRRRLESERWRRLFAHEVRKNVQLVTKIRRRGA